MKFPPTRFAAGVAATDTRRSRAEKTAPRVTLSAESAAETVSISAATGTCTASQGPVHSACDLGTLQRRATVTVSIIARAPTLGALTLSVRATLRASAWHRRGYAKVYG